MTSSAAPARKPAVSVIVACVESVESLGRCVASIAESCRGIETEIFVVSDLQTATLRDVLSSFPEARVIAMEKGTLVPRLWSEGIAASAAPVVMLTISQCSVSPGWVPSLVAAISEGVDAAGGPISLLGDATPTDYAVFFLRYSAFLSSKRQSAEIAGDNCAYSRAALETGGWSRESGFWEIEVNRKLRDAGRRIAWVPEAKVFFGNAGNLSSNTRRRFQHGRQFGATRRKTRGESAMRIALAAPLVPLVLFGRAAFRVWSDKAYRRPLVASVPAFAVLSAAWSLGEATGAIGGGHADRG